MANNNKRKNTRKSKAGNGNQNRSRPQPKQQRQRKKNGNPNRSTTSTAIVSQNRVTVNNATNSPGPLNGCDLLVSTKIPTTAQAGDIFVDAIIAPEAFTRMKVLASAYQRIRYHRMKFYIQASASTLTAGTFGVAFVADVTDRPPTTKGADNWICAQSMAKTSSYWQPVIVDMPYSSDLLYTSPQDSELRWSSPGRLALVVITPPTSEVLLSVLCDWTISLSTPSIEPSLESTVDALYTSMVPFAMVQTATADSDLEQLFKVRETGTRLLTPDDFSPPLPTGTYLEIPDGPVTIVANTGGSGAPMSMTATHIGTHLSGSDLGIAYFTYLEQSNSFQLASTRSTPPMTVAPSAVPEYYSGTIFEVAPQSLQASFGAGSSFLSRNRRSLTSGPIRLEKLPSGKIVSFRGLTKL